MSISAAVDEGYRIHLADLDGQEWEWVITNVSYQGVEEMSPVLHLQGLSKRFVLDAEQSRQMMALTRSPIPEEWIGATIRVAPKQTADNGSIAITSAKLPVVPHRWPPVATRLAWLTGIVLLVVVLWMLVAQFLQP